MELQTGTGIPMQRESDSSFRGLLEMHPSTNGIPYNYWKWLSRRTWFMVAVVVLSLCCMPMALWPLSRLNLELENEFFLSILAASSFSVSSAHRRTLPRGASFPVADRSDHRQPFITLLLNGSELASRALRRGRSCFRRSWFLGLNIACTLCLLGSGIMVALFLTESRYTTHGDLKCPKHPEKPRCYAELYDKEGVPIALNLFYFVLTLLNTANCILIPAGARKGTGHSSAAGVP